MNSSNIGNRIKDAAEIVRGFGIFLSIIVCVLLIVISIFSEDEWIVDPTILGICIGIGGAVSVWLFSLVLYGFGVLINTTNDIKSHISECKNAMNDE